MVKERIHAQIGNDSFFNNSSVCLEIIVRKFWCAVNLIFHYVSLLPDVDTSMYY